MAIHRVGQQLDSMHASWVLGHLIVTIDDLEALMEILRQDASDPATVQVRFSSGYFTDAADLQRLSDGEILLLRVVSDTGIVILSPSRAAAGGNPAVFEKILDWASARRSSRFERAQWCMLLLMLGGIFGALTSWSLIEGLHYPPWSEALKMLDVSASALGNVLVASLLTIGFGALVSYSRNKRAGANMVALSSAEFRRLKHNNRWPRTAAIAAVAGVVVATVAVLVTLLIANWSP